MALAILHDLHETAEQLARAVDKLNRRMRKGRRDATTERLLVRCRSLREWFAALSRAVAPDHADYHAIARAEKIYGLIVERLEWEYRTSDAQWWDGGSFDTSTLRAPSGNVRIDGPAEVERDAMTRRRHTTPSSARDVISVVDDEPRVPPADAAQTRAEVALVAEVARANDQSACKGRKARVSLLRSPRVARPRGETPCAFVEVVQGRLLSAPRSIASARTTTLQARPPRFRRQRTSARTQNCSRPLPKPCSSRRPA